MNIGFFWAGQFSHTFFFFFFQDVFSSHLTLSRYQIPTSSILPPTNPIPDTCITQIYLLKLLGQTATFFLIFFFLGYAGP